MSIELKQAAQDAAEAIDWLLKNIRLDAPQLSGKAMGNAEKCASALRAAIQQPEPVAPDSSEHLRVIASLGAALRQLSFAAQTTGGTDGPDADLQSAIGQAEQALSLGGIWQAMSATGEPVAVAAPHIAMGFGRYEVGSGTYKGTACIAFGKNGTGNVGELVTIEPRQMSAEETVAVITFANVDGLNVLQEKVDEVRALHFPDPRPAPSVPADVMRDAERGRFLVGWLKRFGLLQAEFGQIGAGEKPEDWWLLQAPWGIDKSRPFFGHGKTPEQAIDAAMLAAKDASA